MICFQDVYDDLISTELLKDLNPKEKYHPELNLFFVAMLLYN